MINNKKKKNKKKMSKTIGKPTAARRIRTKTRKPKFLSLISLELMSSEKAQETTETPPTDDDVNKGQLQYLFPLHPENLVEENYYNYNNNNNNKCSKDTLHDENMAYLFSSAADGGGSASTLTGLLGSSTGTTRTSSSSYNSGEKDDYYYNSQLALVRTALKNKERDSSEERYVRYSEVVERRRDEEVSSTAAAAADDDDLRCGINRIGNQKRLSLKLDYEDILNAWSDKGPLYVYAESPRTVPDIIHHQFLPHEFPTISNEAASDNGWRNYGCLWRVPELTRNIDKVHELKEQKKHQQEQEPVVVVGGVDAEEEWKVGQREASVLRYKEKRQNRLFAKRIRYQVRKLNAEKRPREKGRFVKRS